MADEIRAEMVANVWKVVKAVGDEVTADEPLLEVSTDKVDTEIPSPVAGTLQEIRVNEDETAEVGSVLAVIGSGAAAAPAPAAPQAPAQEAPAQQAPKQEAPKQEAPKQEAPKAAPPAAKAAAPAPKPAAEKPEAAKPAAAAPKPAAVPAPPKPVARPAAPKPAARPAPKAVPKPAGKKTT